MNTIRRVMTAAVLIGFAASYGHSQGLSVPAQTVPFDNPGRPGIVKIISGEGDITIIGYAGKEVRIKTTAANKKNDPKTKGLNGIAGFSITADREENAVVITRLMEGKTYMEIQVPYKTSLKIGLASSTKDSADVNKYLNSAANGYGFALSFSGGMFGGTIKVENITGEMEISTLEGDIMLKNISGAVVANCGEGNITAVFRKVTEGRPMAFSTIDGKIDVTLPKQIKATLTASNVEGGIYTDFEIETVPGAGKRGEKGTSGLLKVPVSTVTGKLNGGGIDIQMKTIDGSISIRKAK